MGQPDKTVQYVRDAIGKHIESGMLEDWESDALAIDGWLGDCPQDLITHATAKVLGMERLDKLVAAAGAATTSTDCLEPTRTTTGTLASVGADAPVAPLPRRGLRGRHRSRHECAGQDGRPARGTRRYEGLKLSEAGRQCPHGERQRLRLLGCNT